MQSADLQACLGFLQAIHYSAKVANVNKEICQSLSRVVGRIRPCLEEVDMADSGEQHNSSLRMIENSLEKIHVAIGRFSTMGYLQSVLEAQAMCENFSTSRDTMIQALETLAESKQPCYTKDWRDDVQRVCELLRGLRFEDCDHLQVAKRVHATARQVMDEEIERKTGHVLIRSQLLANRSIGPKAMQEEIQGLERELSRARVEKEKHEVEELHTIIRALKQSSDDSEQDSRPQPPVEYLCPISRRIMKDPVVLVETGQTYDRKYIEEWFGRGNRTCPATKQTVTELHLTPNYALKSLAGTWLDVNSVGDEDEEVVFHRSKEPESPSGKKGASVDDVKRIAASCMNGGYGTMIECGYSTMDIPHVSQALTTSSSINTTLISKKGKEPVGSSREDSYSGKNSKEEDIQKTEAVSKMQTANVVNPLATNASMPINARQNPLVVPSLASKFAHASRVHSKFTDLAETRSSEQYETTTPRSSFSEFSKRRSNADAMGGLNDAIQKLAAARRLPFQIEAEERTPLSSRSSKTFFRTDGKATTQHRLPTRRHYAASVSSSASKQDKETELRQYEELDKIENSSDAGTEQQPTDEAEEDCLDFADDASLTTIGSHATKYAQSICMKPMQKIDPFGTGHVQGATNVLFGEDGDDDGSSSGGDEQDTNDVSLPVLANLLKTDDPHLAASLASELALKAATDRTMFQDISRLDIVSSLVKLLSMPSDAAKAAASRALGVIGERNPEAKLQILNAGAIAILSRLNKQAEDTQGEMEEGSLEDVAGATRFALSALNSNTRDAASEDVSPQMLVELLMSPIPEMQASAVLELLEKLDSVYAEIVLKELTQSTVLLSLVDMLEHKEEDVQLAAAEILSRMIYNNQKTQKELSESVGITSKLLRLIKQGGSEKMSCKSAAAQVIRGLAHNNSKIREDVLRRGVISEFASLLCCNDPQTRESAAWMLGYLASHSQNGQDEVSGCDQAMFVLKELADNGGAQEKIAAKFALRAIDSEDAGCDDDDELSSQIVIQSLQMGTKEVKIAAAWELCRIASSNQWSQIEIYECGGVTALLTYLKARPGADGIQACLATLVKLASSEARIASQISQEGGVPLAVRLLKSPATPDKKLVIQLLTLLAERCPLHQQEMVSNGAVPVLVDLLFSDEVICNSACQAISCLIENDMSVVSSAVAECATPSLLDIVANCECSTYTKKAAIQLVGKMGESTFDTQSVVIQQGGMDVLMNLMQEGDDQDIMFVAAQAVKSLSKKGFRDNYSRAFPKMIQALPAAMNRRKGTTPGLVQMGDVASNPMAAAPSYGSHSSTIGKYGRSLSRKQSMANSLVLSVVPEPIPEESETEDADDTQSATIQEAPESPVSRTTVEPMIKQQTPFEVCMNDTFSECPESIPEEPVMITPIAPKPMVPIVPKHIPSVTSMAPKSARAHREVAAVTHFMENLTSHGRDLKEMSMSVNKLRSSGLNKREIGSRLWKEGALGLMVDSLRPPTYR